MSANIEADEVITTEASNWVFDEHVAPHFNEHVRKSVPEYGLVQELAVTFSDLFTHSESTVLDFGAASFNEECHGPTMVKAGTSTILFHAQSLISQN